MTRVPRSHSGSHAVSEPSGPEQIAWDEALRARRAGRLEDCLTALARVIRETGPLTSAARRMRASVLRDLGIASRLGGDEGRAAYWIGRALDEAPEYPDLHLERGLLHLDRAELDHARVSFQKALDLAPSFVSAELELALLDARGGQLGEAVTTLRRMAERRPPAEDLLFRDGLDRLRAGAWEAAADRLRASYHAAQSAWKQGSLRVGLRLEEGRAPEALDEACRLAERFPHFPDAHFAVGLCSLALEWWDDAAEALLRALERNPGYHEARVYLACALFGAREARLAEEELSRVLRSSPGHEWALRLQADRKGGMAAMMKQKLAVRPAA
ncbi:MAG TPA: tetratricopeptide repeat protein [Candidatus Eisenbacteria bacterium]|nr:tetratricopeptide repeat protein [Candidatus Eisenbacteria bacterium]